MHDKKTIRRRRAVLLLLVVVSLVLLTDYFGGSDNSPLHSIQRGVGEVLSPVDDGASRLLSPVRDVAGYFSSTLKAKSQNAELLKANHTLRNELAGNLYNKVELKRLQGLLKLDNQVGLRRDGLLGATVVDVDSSDWYDQVMIDKGSDAGVKANDPVVGPGGLVGRIAEAGASYAWVSLITSPKFAVGAMVEDGSDDSGVLEPKVGDPTTLVLSSLQSDDGGRVATDQEVVTSGFKDSSDSYIRSFFPAGIPIGSISTQDTEGSIVNGGTVDVTPAVNLTHLTDVQVLTRPHG